MNSILYENRCRCKEVIFSKKIPQGVVRPANYPELDEISMKTFQISYDHELSLEAKLILKSLQKKYIYYAIDDISYALNLSGNERDILLAFLYSPMISLHNTDCIDFFNIWIHDLTINKTLKMNRFLKDKCYGLYQITITIVYKTKDIAKIQESLW